VRKTRAFYGALQGNYWTLAPQVARSLSPPTTPPGVPFRHTFEGAVGEITLSGELHVPDDALRHEDLPLIIVVHGLGGSIESGYTKDAAWAAIGAGAACLRINLRGASRNGDDIYHAGLREDLDQLLRAKALARFQRIHILGYSLGGHLTLCFAADPSDRRVQSFGAICPPLLLAPGIAHIDRKRYAPYRRHVLKGLKEIFAAYATRGRPLPCAPSLAAGAKTLREWDTRVVAPHFGFDSAEHYWESQSAGRTLRDITRPTLIVTAEFDPMVPYPSAAQLLNAQSGDDSAVTCVVLRQGGHVGFPRVQPLQVQSDGESVEAQMVHWLLGA
jgi:predicted alpha/beta-fold hydrolase